MIDCPQAAFCEYSGSAQPTWLWLEDLVEVVEARQPADVLAKLQTVEQAVQGGLYAAGFISYEAAPAMDAALWTHSPGELPLLWFGLFRRMGRSRRSPARPAGQLLGRSLAALGHPRAIRREPRPHPRLHRRGHTYQVNYTFRLRAGFAGTPGVSSGGWRRPSADDTRRTSIPAGTCSARPRRSCSSAWTATALLTRPMKGTAARGLSAAEDRRQPQGPGGIAQGPGRERHDRRHDAQRPGANRRPGQRPRGLGLRRGEVPDRATR